MARRREKCNEVWWLARGSYSRSRQPSFAPPSARPAVSMSFYGFGWNRRKSCFVTTKQLDIVSSVSMDEYPCDSEVALGILEQCASEEIRERFFSNPYAQEDDEGHFEAAGSTFSISLSQAIRLQRLRYIDAVASLYFYAPDGERRSVSLHSGMAQSFAQTLVGIKIDDIRAHME